MSVFPFGMFQPFSFGRFDNAPVTDWQGAFSPTLNLIFGGNPQDAPIEAHLLKEVGSYGKQLGVLIRVMDILQARVDRTGLDAEQKQAMIAFDTLRDEATRAAREFRAKVTDDEIVGLVKAFKENRSGFEAAALRQRIDGVLSDEAGKTG